MSWVTVGEIVLWLSLAGALGIVLGWLLHEIWNRAKDGRDTAESEPVPEAAIKGKRTSMIYHVPGSPMYERTQADVWFTTEAEAEGAGYRKPKNQ